MHTAVHSTKPGIGCETKLEQLRYFYLIIAIVGEVIGTISIKNSEGFTQPIPSSLVIIGYLIAFYFMMLSMKTIPVAITYSIWAGIGITAIAVISSIKFGEIPDLYAIIGLIFIIIGIFILVSLSNMG